MRDRLGLLAYLGGLLFLTSVHDLRILGGVLAGLLLLAGPEAPRILRRAVAAVLLFNGVVSLGYFLQAHLQGIDPWPYLLLLNLRVLTLTTLTFWGMGRIHPFRALAFSRTLSLLLVLAYSQILTFRRTLEGYRLALRSRALRPPRREELYAHAAATFAYLMGQALRNAEETALALRSRGVDLD